MCPAEKVVSNLHYMSPRKMISYGLDGVNSPIYSTDLKAMVQLFGSRSVYKDSTIYTYTGGSRTASIHYSGFLASPLHASRVHYTYDADQNPILIETEILGAVEWIPSTRETYAYKDNVASTNYASYGKRKKNDGKTKPVISIHL